MHLRDAVHVLPIRVGPDGQAGVFNLSLITDATEGATLVDTGLPGQYDAIAGALAEAGVSVETLARIVLTHHDIDHVGALHDLVRASRARVLAHDVEAPYINGAVTPRFATPEAQEQHPQLRAVAAHFRPTPVDELLEDNALLPVVGGVRVVFSPGHTPGHICLYHERSRTLIAGDALAAEDGRLRGPNPSATPDMPLAAQSVRKLSALDVQAIVCYHGGVVDDDAQGQLRRVADELAA
jgi:glyoxylase-like metal-dependent hydrolase (beta-lactamase superfamily II)